MGRQGYIPLSDNGKKGLWYQQHYFIYTIDFEMKTISDEKDEMYGTAVWVEANSRKRYCYGPSVNPASCSSAVRDDDPVPVNEDMPEDSDDEMSDA
jgi:hypothetical protein